MKYLIVDLENAVVWQTDSDDIASDFTGSDYHLVIDTENLTFFDTESNPVEIPEVEQE